MTDAKAAKVVTQDKGELERQYPRMADMVRDLRASAALIDGEEQRMADISEILENILSAPSEAELFQAQEANGLSTQDFVNTPFRLRATDIQWRNSTFDAGFPVYASMRIRQDDGTETRLNGGGWSFVSVLYKLLSFGSFDGYEDEGRPFIIVEKQTQSGYTVLLLKPLPSSPKNGK